MSTELRLDTNVTESVVNWFLYGLPPGSWTTALIVRDYERCIYSAHEMILFAVKDHLTWVDCYLPYQAKDMDTWKGYHNMSEEEQRNVTFTDMMNAELLDKIN